MEKKAFMPGFLQGDYTISRFVFTRFIALIYLMAFVSLAVQIIGLVGENGILPATQYLQSIENAVGADKFIRLPTIFWFNSSDVFLLTVCIGGIVIAALAIAGLLQAEFLFLLWFLYLSLVNICQNFTHFQWDILLLETGFLAIFFAPLKIYSPAKNAQPPSKWIVFLLNWLLFRLMFASGLAKILSQDLAWWDLTALTYHYETQPLPNTISWYAHQLPLWFQKISTGIMFVVELFLPFLIFFPRYFRLFVAFSFILFMILIMITGNYGFFNLTAMALCIPLIDDNFFKKFLPQKFINRFNAEEFQPIKNKLKIYVLIALTSFIFLFSLNQFTSRFFQTGFRANWIQKIQRQIYTYRITNTYGLFSVMTKTRPEIIIEGSKDGQNWKAYEFKWKPGKLDRAPVNVIPHMPRVDWQMWFAALSNYQRNRWMLNLLMRLLQGQKNVLNLFEHNPFPDTPPTYIRSRLYRYNFTNQAERAATGNWWKRQLLREYTPVMELNE